MALYEKRPMWILLAIVAGEKCHKGRPSEGTPWVSEGILRALRRRPPEMTSVLICPVLSMKAVKQKDSVEYELYG